MWLFQFFFVVVYFYSVRRSNAEKKQSVLASKRLHLARDLFRPLFPHPSSLHVLNVHALLEKRVDTACRKPVSHVPKLRVEVCMYHATGRSMHPRVFVVLFEGGRRRGVVSGWLGLLGLEACSVSRHLVFSVVPSRQKHRPLYMVCGRLYEIFAAYKITSLAVFFSTVKSLVQVTFVLNKLRATHGRAAGRESPDDG